jgi:hypothetical protein
MYKLKTSSFKHLLSRYALIFFSSLQNSDLKNPPYQILVKIMLGNVSGLFRCRLLSLTAFLAALLTEVEIFFLAFEYEVGCLLAELTWFSATSLFAQLTDE